jgi:beta-N-acetylhexosaminidase
MIDFKKNPFFLNDTDVAWVNDTLGKMSRDEKIRQLFCLIAYSSDREYLDHLCELGICGVMLRIMPTDEVVDTVTKLQSAAKIPMLLSANLEAGGNGVCISGTRFGCELSVAATGDVEYAERLGDVCGAEASALGLNWAFSPIIDVDMNFRNPITNTRTFGSNPDMVAAFGEAYVKAVQSHGLAASIKHFPGDGTDERDQHLVTSINNLSVKEWDATYGKIYRACIEAGAKTVMAGHIMHPAYSRYLVPGIEDKDILPGSLSRELLTNLLRDRLGFNGLVVTDSTAMAGFGIPMSREKAVPLSIAAGCDIFLFTKNLEEDIAFMTKGVEDGVITPKRLDEAVSRILALKASLKLHTKKLIPNAAEIERVVGCEKHHKWAKECADHAITLVKEEKGVLPMNPDKCKRILLYPIESEASAIPSFGIAAGAPDRFKAMLESRGYLVDTFTPPASMEGMMTPYKEIPEKYDLLLYVANLATKSNQTVVRIEWNQPMGANVPAYAEVVPTIFVSFENPYHLLDVPRIKTYINTYGSSDVILEQLLDKLEGKSAFKGVSPVDAFCGKWDTRL